MLSNWQHIFRDNAQTYTLYAAPSVKTTKTRRGRAYRIRLSESTLLPIAADCIAAINLQETLFRIRGEISLLEKVVQLSLIAAIRTSLKCCVLHARLCSVAQCDVRNQVPSRTILRERGVRVYVAFLRTLSSDCFLFYFKSHLEFIYNP